MRRKLWSWLKRNHEPGVYLSGWLRAARWILFPIQTARWVLGEGYDIRTDSWGIGGVRYCSESMEALARSKGELFRIERTGDVVVVTRVGDTWTPHSDGYVRRRTPLPVRGQP